MADLSNNKPTSQDIEKENFMIPYKECTKDLLAYLAKRYPKNPLLDQYRHRQVHEKTGIVRSKK